MKKLTILLAAILLYCATYAQGFYFEMKMSSSKQGPMGTMKAYVQDGNTRSQISMTSPMAMEIVTLTLKTTPNTVYMLSDKDKTYSEVDISKSEQWKDSPQDEYEITVIGKENVNGYNSTHVKVKRKDSKVEQELWVTTEIHDYAAFMNAKTKYTGRQSLNKALEAKGVMGFPVRILVNEHGSDVQIDFVKAEKKDNAASLFSLDGYTKSGGQPGGAAMQEMMQKMQNMTPEERKAFIEQMRQQNQGSHQ
jgi:uncharacterized protein DUF4412